MNIEKAKIYGVDKVGSSNPNDLLRTDDAVGLNYTVGESEITSDFDTCYPWSDMQEYTDKATNVFIKIPKFYARITKNADGTFKHQISGVRYEGFSTLFIDGAGNELDYILVGKYEGSYYNSISMPQHIYSKSDRPVKASITIDDFRAGCRAHGAGYQQYDFLIDLIIKELWLVEMKTTNSKSVMYGYANGNSAAVATGRTDSVKTPSGSEVSNTDGKHAMKYRGIENLWGNTYTWCDGISFDNEKIYICTDPKLYSGGKITAPYIYHGDRSEGGYITQVAPLARHPLIQYATEASGGSDNTYFSDKAAKSSMSGTVLYFGGAFDKPDAVGLWHYIGAYDSSRYFPNISGRLCYKPI